MGLNKDNKRVIDQETCVYSAMKMELYPYRLDYPVLSHFHLCL